MFYFIVQTIFHASTFILSHNPNVKEQVVLLVYSVPFVINEFIIKYYFNF